MIENIILENIIEISLVALGLVIALYTIILDQLNEIGDKHIKGYKQKSKEAEVLFEKLSKKKDDTDLLAEYQSLLEQKKALLKPPYHYNWGYIASGILFAITIIFPYYAQYFSYEQLGNFAFFVDYAPHILFAGIINFIYIWIKTMIDLRNLSLTRFDILEEKEEKEEDNREKRKKH